MVLQAILLGLAAFIAQLDYATGDSLISRPLVTGAVVGLIMGNLQEGVVMGATLELAFIGMFSVGASIPPEVITGGILGVSFAISAHASASEALVLALPIATLALIIKNIYIGIGIPYLSHKADQAADAGDADKVSRIQVIAGLGLALLLALVVCFSFLVGSNAVKSFLGLIPKFVQHGLTVATGIIPALGFAMLAQVILSKKVAPYFFLGFFLMAYLKISLMGIAIFGAILSIVLVGIQGNFDDINKNIAQGTGDNDDDF